MRDFDYSQALDPATQIEALQDFYFYVDRFMELAERTGEETAEGVSGIHDLVSAQAEDVPAVDDLRSYDAFLFTPTHEDFPDTAPWRFITMFNRDDKGAGLVKLMADIRALEADKPCLESRGAVPHRRTLILDEMEECAQEAHLRMHFMASGLIDRINKGRRLRRANLFDAYHLALYDSAPHKEIHGVSSQDRGAGDERRQVVLELCAVMTTLHRTYDPQIEALTVLPSSLDIPGVPKWSMESFKAQLEDELRGALWFMGDAPLRRRDPTPEVA